MKRDNKTGRILPTFQFTIDELLETYEMFGELKKTAQFLGISAEGLRKIFIKNKIPYKTKVKYTCDDNFFEIDSPESFYWAGFLAADGNVSKNQDIGLTLCTTDILHIEKFKSALNSNSPITNFSRAPGKICNHPVGITYSSRFRVRSIKLASSLKKFNIVPNKTKIYTFPTFVIGHKYMWDFIRGYFDGDGWYRKNAVCWGICGTEQFILTIRSIFNKYLGIDNVKIIKQNNIYKLQYNKIDSVKLISTTLYDSAETYLDRKFELAKKND